jgi:DNA-binding transcriptional ArsR family regulator
VDGFTLIADPTRRRILDRLRSQDSDVGGLVDALGLPQPLVSKHLRVLRDAGAVTSRVVGRRRVYRLGVDPLPDVLAWVNPYHARWSRSLDRLAAVLDAQEDEPWTTS